MPRRPGVSIVTGAYPRGVRHTTFLQPRQFPVVAGLVPALARPTDGLHRKARPGACTAFRQKTLTDFCHRSHEFPPDCSPPQFRDAPEENNQIPKLTFPRRPSNLFPASRLQLLLPTCPTNAKVRGLFVSAHKHLSLNDPSLQPVPVSSDLPQLILQNPSESNSRPIRANLGASQIS